MDLTRQSVSMCHLAGFPLLDIERDALVCMLATRLRSGTQTVLLYANTNFVVQCRPLLPALAREPVLIVNDGVGMDIASLLMRGCRFRANLNGTDFTPYLLSRLPAPQRVFLLGGRPDIVQRAAQYVAKELGQVVVGTCDGFEGLRDEARLVEAINASGADVLLVAMGNPRQERWILEHLPALQVRLVSGVGALFDFWAGDKPRAPGWVRRLRMEWLYRLCLEPKRLLRRYTVDVLVFLALCVRYRAVRGTIEQG